MFNEANIENAIIELFSNHLGYNYIYAPSVTRDYHNPLLEEQLTQSLETINPNIPRSLINEAISKLKKYDTNNLLQNNEQFMEHLQNGLTLSSHINGEQQNYIVNLIDYNPDNINNNSFIISNQWTIDEYERKRLDIVIFINGLPLVIMELKSCSSQNTEVSDAYKQLRNYMQDIPSMFTYNAFCVMTDLVTSKVGTITSSESRYMEWKTITGDYEETKIINFDTLFLGMFQKNRLLDIIKNFILFSKSSDKKVKILSAYHQYFAVNKAVLSTKNAIHTDGKGGIFWHTQGSGKSLSMVFYAKLLTQLVDNPTIVVLTDRNDLDDQLYTQFSNCTSFLRQTPKQAESRTDLKNLLNGRTADGIIFTTMQKFEESTEPLSNRRNIILMADEAHRSQYALDEKVNKDTGKITLGYARLIRESLPNATFIGFTGTPIAQKDRNTKEVFGEYIDVYDMTQAVEDNATRPVYYENRVINLGLNEDVLKKIDSEYENLSKLADENAIEKSKKQLSKMDEILGAPETIKTLCTDIVAHYEDRQDILTGKAMIVTYSRDIAIKIYEQLLELRPTWIDKINVVMTSSNQDPEHYKKIIGNKAYKTELARKFKDDEDVMKIAIVVDMWLTGFDVPSLATMYVYKPMEGHNLMQAIARVNRVFKDKEGGLVVDYVGIATALKKAMSDFTMRDRKNYGDTDVSKIALPKFIEKLNVCKDLFHGFDYTKFITGSDLDRAITIQNGIDFIVADETKKDLFVKESTLLKQAQTLCRSLLDKNMRFEAAFFDVVRTVISRILSNDKISVQDINKRISELLKHSIKTEGVINLFSDAQRQFSLFDEVFLKEVYEMKQKNLAIMLLEKLISEQITIYKRTNLVQSTVFSEKMKQLMNRYRNGQITNAEVIDEIINIAHDIKNDHEAADKMGLSSEEKAFYDAITKPEAVKDFFNNDALVAITKELTNTLRKNRTVDWSKKETARAEMRRMVKRLLKKYKYPPEGVTGACELILSQCEMWTDNLN